MSEEFLLDPRRLTKNLCVNHEKKYVFVDNPKSASSTIKRELWDIEMAEGRQDREAAVTDIHGGGFLKTDFGREIEGYFTFAAVRNPYARVLSAYLDKIQHDRATASIFRRQARLPMEGEISFAAFVDAIHGSSPCENDRHWTLQTDNLLQRSVRIDWVASLENIESLFDLFRERFGSTRVRPDRSSHTTGASRKVLEYYTEEIRVKVADHYREDFESFGYPLDLDRCGEVPKIDGSPLPVDPRRSELVWSFLDYRVDSQARRKLEEATVDPATRFFAEGALSLRRATKPDGDPAKQSNPIVLVGWLKQSMAGRRFAEAGAIADRLIELVPQWKEAVVARAAVEKAMGTADSDNRFLADALSMTWKPGLEKVRKRVARMARGRSERKMAWGRSQRTVFRRAISAMIRRAKSALHFRVVKRL